MLKLIIKRMLSLSLLLMLVAVVSTKSVYAGDDGDYEGSECACDGSDSDPNCDCSEE